MEDDGWFAEWQEEEEDDDRDTRETRAVPAFRLPAYTGPSRPVLFHRGVLAVPFADYRKRLCEWNEARTQHCNECVQLLSGIAYEDRTDRELRIELEARGLLMEGSRLNLINRLRQHDRGEIVAIQRAKPALFEAPQFANGYSASFGLLGLPHALVQHLFHHCSDADLFSAMRSCKYLYRDAREVLTVRAVEKFGPGGSPLALSLFHDLMRKCQSEAPRRWGRIIAMERLAVRLDIVERNGLLVRRKDGSVAPEPFATEVLRRLIAQCGCVEAFRESKDLRFFRESLLEEDARVRRQSRSEREEQLRRLCEEYFGLSEVLWTFWSRYHTGPALVSHSIRNQIIGGAILGLHYDASALLEKFVSGRDLEALQFLKDTPLHSRRIIRWLVSQPKSMFDAHCVHAIPLFSIFRTTQSGEIKIRTKEALGEDVLASDALFESWCRHTFFPPNDQVCDVQTLEIVSRSDCTGPIYTVLQLDANAPALYFCEPNGTESPPVQEMLQILDRGPNFGIYAFSGGRSRFRKYCLLYEMTE